MKVWAVGMGAQEHPSPACSLPHLTAHASMSTTCRSTQSAPSCLPGRTSLLHARHRIGVQVQVGAADGGGGHAQHHILTGVGKSAAWHEQRGRVTAVEVALRLCKHSTGRRTTARYRGGAQVKRQLVCGSVTSGTGASMTRTSCTAARERQVCVCVQAGCA